MPAAAPEPETPYSPNMSHILPPLQMALLLALRQNGGSMSLTRLADETGSHVSTTGGSLTALRANGYATKLTESPKLGHYAITEEGEAALWRHYAFYRATDPWRGKR